MYETWSAQILPNIPSVLNHPLQLKDSNRIQSSHTQVACTLQETPKFPKAGQHSANLTAWEKATATASFKIMVKLHVILDPKVEKSKILQINSQCVEEFKKQTGNFYCSHLFQHVSSFGTLIIVIKLWIVLQKSYYHHQCFSFTHPLVASDTMLNIRKVKHYRPTTLQKWPEVKKWNSLQVWHHLWLTIKLTETIITLTGQLLQYEHSFQIL